MITRNTAFVYKGKRRDVKTIGRVGGGRRLTQREHRRYQDVENGHG
jgi:TolB-like protein